MKKLLFIIQSYPSERSANVNCDEKIMQALLRTGKYEIHCLTYQYDRQPLEDRINGFFVHRFRKGWVWDLYTWARHHGTSPVAKLILFLHKFHLRLKQLVCIPIYPCYEPINCRRYVKAAEALQAREHFDLVFAEHNGFDTLYAGSQLKKKHPKLIFVAALWDPFTGKKSAKYLPRAYCEKKMQRSEAALLTRADRIIAMQASLPYHRKHSTRKTYYPRFRFFDLPGIVPPMASPCDTEFLIPGKINLLYAGLLNLPERDPTALLQALGKLSVAAKLNLIFLCSGEGAALLNRLRPSFPGTLTVHSFVDQQTLASVMEGADGFLNIGGSNPLMVPSKLFQYFSYGKPVISACQIAADACKPYLDRYPLGICLLPNESEADQNRRLESFFADRIGERLPFASVEKLFPEQSPSAYVDLINELCGVDQASSAAESDDIGDEDEI